MPRRALLLTLLAGLATAAGGCGETFRTDRPILRITLDEYRIVPQNIEVKRGRYKFAVRNTGNATHNLVIQSEDEDGRWIELPGGRVNTMQPGQTGTAIKLDLAPGEYRLVCTIANHDDLGQFGTLTVTG